MQPSIWQRRFTLLRPIDGDTIWAHIDDGRRHYSHESIRLKDVYAPELFSGSEAERQAGAEATNELRFWFEEHVHHYPAAFDLAADFPFRLNTERDRQTFNRYVGEIECGEEHSLNSHMRNLGYVEGVDWG